MGQPIIRGILTIGLAVAGLAIGTLSQAAGPDFRLVGLAVHQETGREIYLGAVHVGKMVAKPADLVSAPGPKIMEYRIIARRTSVRSLLGNSLLQGELASGESPPVDSLEFADLIMDAVQGSLYTGDSFEVLLSEDNNTVARLNGYDIAQISGRAVADYFMRGWVGQRGPSTAFRNGILSSDLDASLLSVYDANTAPQERVEQVASWANGSETEATETAEVIAAAAVAAAVPSPAPAPEVAVEETTEPAVEVASSHTLDDLQPVVVDAQRIKDPNDIANLDIIAYSSRLAEFNTEVLKKVYANIRYPRVAVRRGIQGDLELDITVNKSGSLVDVAVVRSSGHGPLDKSAVAAASKAFEKSIWGSIDPVAVAEYSADGDHLVIPVPVAFILTE